MPAAVTSGKLLSRRNWKHINFSDVSYNSRRNILLPISNTKQDRPCRCKRKTTTANNMLINTCFMLVQSFANQREGFILKWLKGLGWKKFRLIWEELTSKQTVHWEATWYGHFTNNYLSKDKLFVNYYVITLVNWCVNDLVQPVGDVWSYWLIDLICLSIFEWINEWFICLIIHLVRQLSSQPVNK
jgi:hypothetical protein